MADNRHIFIYMIKKHSRLLRRQVDAAVGTVGLINVSSKASPPVCVVKADASVKGHPVFDRRGIIRAS